MGRDRRPRPTPRGPVETGELSRASVFSMALVQILVEKLVAMIVPAAGWATWPSTR